MTNYLEKVIEPVNQWYQTSSIHAFFEWWTSELKSLIPKSYRENLFPDSKQILIKQVDGDDEVQIWQQHNNEIDLVEFDDSVKGKEWWHQLNHYVAGSDQETKVTFLLKESDVLSREVAMPIVVINDIDSVLSFELDKYLPFTAADVAYDFRKGQVEEGSEKFPVLLTAVKKEKLKEIVEQTESKGLKLSAIDVNVGVGEQPEAMGVNLMPKSLRMKKDWTSLKWHAGLAAVTLLMLSFVMYTSLNNKRAKIQSLEVQVDELKKDARRAKMIETQLNESIQAANFLGNLKQNIPSRVVMIGELTKKIPVNTYLTRIVIDDEKLEIVGESDNANALVPILNQSDLWYEPQIIGNVTQGRTGKEKFTIKSDLKPMDVDIEENANGS
ncbi:PilN domain-containing protein [Marinicella litoralis]|uniref:Fimbrial assembly protein PilN n=1 Tax=Marinicella litoralis TaxID=644220 RepID=A0A4R6XS06_9GAMM|nr:PilN domain-containing protein [Marinicella litoralis]TDR20804.1 fimbrial assembly protein PilN [Marinicella litoralis]